MEFRESRPEDAAEIAELCERVLDVPKSSPMFSQRHMQWKYWEPWSEWPGSRGYVLIRGERIVAHAGVWPLHTRRDGVRHTWAHLFDWAAEPKAIGSGVVLLKRVASLAAGMIIVGGSRDTQRVVTPLGFRQWGEAIRCVLRSPNGSLIDNEDKGIEIAALSTDAESFEPASGSGELRFERSAPWLSGLARCPVAEFEAFRVERAGARLGEFVLAYVPFQSRLVATSFGSGCAPEQALVVRQAVKRAVSRQPSADVVAITSSTPELRALEAAGFSECGTLPMFIAAPPEVAPPESRLRFQMLDGDVAFLHHAAPDPW